MLSLKNCLFPQDSAFFLGSIFKIQEKQKNAI